MYTCANATIYPCEPMHYVCVHLHIQLHIDTHEKKKRREEGIEQREGRNEKGRKTKK